MAETKTTVIVKDVHGNTCPPIVYEDAVGQIVDGCLAVRSQNLTVLYAPGQWLSAWTEKVDG